MPKCIHCFCNIIRIKEAISWPESRRLDNKFRIKDVVVRVFYGALILRRTQIYRLKSNEQKKHHGTWFMHIKSWISCRKKRDIAKEYNMLAHQRRPAFRYCECLGFCATALNAFVVFFSGATKRSMRILRKAPKSHTERFECGRMNTYGNWCDTFAWRHSHEISVCEQSPMFWLCNAHTHTHTPTNTLIRRPPLVRRFRCVFYGLAIPLCRLTCPAGISLILDTIIKIRNDAKDIERRVCDFCCTAAGSLELCV